MELTFLGSLAGYRNSTAVNWPELLLSWNSRGVKLNRPGSVGQSSGRRQLMTLVHSCNRWINRNALMCSITPTLQHAVIRLPVPPPEGFPESRRLRPLITFPNGDVAAAVEACF